ncbi:MAG: zinc ribbon domain-containing protein [Acidobacteria bacterium]|nr:zinc ribbon domain-containing protein [Acidobacteriota bacterium]
MTYEYQCDACGSAFEVRATIAEKARGLRPVCPRCGSEAVTQVHTAVNVLTRSGGGSGPSCCGPRSGGRCV